MAFDPLAKPSKIPDKIREIIVNSVKRFISIHGEIHDLSGVELAAQFVSTVGKLFPIISES